MQYELYKLCKHKKFPCRECGTKHFDNCECAFCREEPMIINIRDELKAIDEEWRETYNSIRDSIDSMNPEGKQLEYIVLCAEALRLADCRLRLAELILKISGN